MPLEHELALLKAEEFAAEGKQVSYKLSWYIAQAESLNRLIWLMMKANRSREEIITFLDVSNGFWEISMKVHGGGGTEASMVEVLEQLAEVRAKKFKNNRTFHSNVFLMNRIWGVINRNVDGGRRYVRQLG